MSKAASQGVKKSSDIGGMFKDAAILLAITLIAGLLLGLVYQITKEPIAVQKEKAKQEACRAVFEDAAVFAEMEAVQPDAQEWAAAGFAQETIDEVMEAQDASGMSLGYVITVTTKEGYGGDIRFTVGITKEGTVNGIAILEIAETAGLGMRAEEVLAPQFGNKTVEQFRYTKSEAVSDDQIDAISGATITTNAVTNGVNAGLYYFQTKLQ
ncbi:MAG: RnfABCDGE type electron transport complex subunit G [Blautia sp.]|nr:RnfABCDGE type electron transport complex subunit G [Blautia sp.]MCM1201801.1 RnfABCDGE type electron transport complex subunit G [Bacteroides fragilis]